jgi:hypothetical protein
MGLVAIATVLLLGVGCAPTYKTPTYETWRKAGVTRGGLDRDHEECLQEATYPSYEDPSLPRGVLQSVMKVDRGRYVGCMRARGYRRID